MPSSDGPKGPKPPRTPQTGRPARPTGPKRRATSTDPTDTSRRFTPPKPGARKPADAATGGPRRGGGKPARDGEGGGTGKRFGGPAGARGGDDTRKRSGPGGKPPRRDGDRPDRPGKPGERRHGPSGKPPRDADRGDRPWNRRDGDDQGRARPPRGEGDRPQPRRDRDGDAPARPRQPRGDDAPRGARPERGPRDQRADRGPRGPRPDRSDDRPRKPRGDSPKPGGRRPDDDGRPPRGKGPQGGPRKPRHGPGDRDDRKPRDTGRAAPARGPRAVKQGSARAAAVALLDGVLDEHLLLPELTGPGGPLDRLDPPDRARAQRLALDTLRGLERADRMLQKHLQKYPPTTIRNILRLGTTELCRGEAAHGVVNEAVSLAAEVPHGAGMKGLVNAVLRKIAAEGPAAWDALRIPRMPKWLREPLVEAWGGDAIAAMEAAQFQAPALDLTPRDPAEAQALADELNGTLLPTGSIRIETPGKISGLPGYDDGRWWVQDAAAALPARLLAAQPGESVLDLCAAPGGKTMQLAAAGATVTALDVSERRMALVSENLARTGLAATCLTGDALDHQGGPYDAILLDAPCSATGTIRRHPDLPHAKDGSEFADLIALQSRLIDHALTLLAPGGRLVFCTCSLLPDEGEVQVEEALERHPDLSIDRGARDLSGIPADWRSDEGGLRIRPDHWADLGGIDGFYIAVLRR